MTVVHDEHLRQEAAGWFARMRGPGAEAARAEFDAWRSDPQRQATYDRLVQRFEESVILGHSRLSALRLRSSGSRRGPPPAVWWTAAAAGLVLGAIAIVQWVHSQTLQVAPGARYASAPGQIRTIALADDLTVVLDTDTVLTASTKGPYPRLVLERGRVRVQSQRPVEVQADSARIIAERGAFDLQRQGAAQVTVSTLRGDVRSETGGLLTQARTRVAPGQRLILTGGRQAVVTSAPARDRQWPTGLLVFDGARLDQVIAEANRYSVRKIRLANPALARLQVSGGLKVTDPDGLARALGAALGLTVSSAPGGDLVLARTDA